MLGIVAWFSSLAQRAHGHHLSGGDGGRLRDNAARLHLGDGVAVEADEDE
jgi:hypothetical protein